MDSAPQHAVCLLCGGTNPRHARFCGSCGNALSTQITAILPVYTEQVQQSSVLSNPSISAISQISLPPADQSGQQQPLTLPGSSVQPAWPTVQISEASAQLPVVHPTSSVQPALLKQRYQLVRQLGAGGYGVVHKALDMEFGGRQVAIKEMSQAELPGKDVATATDAFKREAFMLAALTHPNLPSIYDYFNENGRWYLVMSYIEGETLEAYLNRSAGRKLPVEKVLMLGIQLASVLSYLHTRNPPIIFRDLKPSNIMRTPENQIYLIDFGIARHFKVGQPKDTVALGSPGYAAPEQYGRAQSTPQTDVYSLGATLHQMLTGIDPSNTPFNHAPLHLPHYPQLSILIACMLDMDPRKRPASMGNIKRELQRISSGRSHPPSQGISSRNQAKQHHISPPSLQVHRFGSKLWQSFLTSATPNE
jgi:serine/threonine protein kinase